MNKLFFLIGASGAGKTTALKFLEKKKLPNLEFCYFDSIGVPSAEEMAKKFGSPEEWQRAKTIEWAKKIKKDYLQRKNAILDGQTRPIFIEEACKKSNVELYEIILFDCDDNARKKRLIARGHPELANESMMNWAKHLREESALRGCKIIDTSELSLNQSVSKLFAFIKKACRIIKQPS